MAVIKFTNSKSSIKKILDYITKETKTEARLISGKDCMPETALAEMMLTKDMFKKSTGRQYIHIVQSFDPKDLLEYEKANEIGLQLAEKFVGFQAVVATHKDRNHIHNHILLNSVNFKTGYKFQQSKKEMQDVKDFSDRLCLENNLSIIEKPTANTDIGRNEYQTALKGESWKIELITTIDEAMRLSKDKTEFISNMNRFGYEVMWTDKRKNITYTTPSGKKCRDNKLHDKKYLKEEMEHEFGKIEKDTIREANGAEDGTENRGIGIAVGKISSDSPKESGADCGNEKESILEWLAAEKAKARRRKDGKRNSVLDIGGGIGEHRNSNSRSYDSLGR